MKIGYKHVEYLNKITAAAAAAAAAAKSLQSCPTLCDPTDSSPPGSSVLVNIIFKFFLRTSCKEE